MNEKEIFDSISVLYKQSWDNFNERRKYEMKISYGIYTIYALSIVGILTQLNKSIVTCSFEWCIGILGLAILILHLFCLRGEFKANFIDRKIAIHFELIMQGLSKSEFSDGFRKEFISKTLLANEKLAPWYKNWSYLMQFIMSSCLYIALIFVTVTYGKG